MGGSPSNINQIMRDSVPDHGFPVDIDLWNLLTDEAATPIGAGTTPVAVVSSGYTYKRWAAANVDTMLCNLRIDRSAAQVPSKAAASLNKLHLRFKLNLALRMAGATDTPRVTVTAVCRAIGGAIKATFTPTSIETDGTVLTNGTCAALGNPTNPALRTWDFSLAEGTSSVLIAPGDRLVIGITPGTHGTDICELHDAFLQVAMNAGYTTLAQRVW